LIFLKLKHDWIGGFCFRMGQIVNMLRARLRDDPRDFHAVNARGLRPVFRAGVAQAQGQYADNGRVRLDFRDCNT